MVILLGPICLLVCADDMDEVEVDTEAFCMEDKLRSLGILSNGDDLALDCTVDFATFKGVNLEAEMPPKKVCLISIFFFFLIKSETKYHYLPTQQHILFIPSKQRGKHQSLFTLYMFPLPDKGICSIYGP